MTSINGSGMPQFQTISNDFLMAPGNPLIDPLLAGDSRYLASFLGFEEGSLEGFLHRMKTDPDYVGGDNPLNIDWNKSITALNGLNDAGSLAEGFQFDGSKKGGSFSIGEFYANLNRLAEGPPAE